MNKEILPLNTCHSESTQPTLARYCTRKRHHRFRCYHELPLIGHHINKSARLAVAMYEEISDDRSSEAEVKVPTQQSLRLRMEKLTSLPITKVEGSCDL